MTRFVKINDNKYLNAAHVVQMKLDGDATASGDDLAKLRLTLFVNGGADVKLRGEAALQVFQQLIAK